MIFITMMQFEQETAQEEQEIKLLKEWLPRISMEFRAYIKGATKALLYAQEDTQKMAVSAAKNGGVLP